MNLSRYTSLIIVLRDSGRERAAQRNHGPFIKMDGQPNPDIVSRQV